MSVKNINSTQRKIQPSVAVNITTHTEGYYLHKTLKSVAAAVSRAEENNITCYVNINLDNPDEITKMIANEFKLVGKVTRYVNQFGDLASSRNFLIEKSKSDYVLFWDGDDLFTENFIVEAVEAAEEYGRPCVVSAENIIKFGKQIDTSIFRPGSTTQHSSIKTALFETNLYISQNLVSREILDHCKYQPNRKGYGFEDWHWNTQVVALGYEFLVAANTSFFYRQKPDDQSLLKKSLNESFILRKTPLFNPDNFIKLPHRPYHPEPEDTQEASLDDSVYVNRFRVEMSRVLIRLFGGNGLIYRSLRHLYRSLRFILSPILHQVRIHTGGSIPVVNSMHTDQALSATHYVTETEFEQWKRLNQIEPLIFFDQGVVSELTDYEYRFEHRMATAYYEICSRYGKNGITELFFMPWLNPGGADLAMLDAASALASAGKKILIVTTSGCPSSWASKVAELRNVELLELHDGVFDGLDTAYKELLLIRLIQNWNINTITIMNSAVGFELLSKYGATLRDVGCRVVVHSFAMPKIDDMLHEPFPHLADAISYIDRVIVDSNAHRQVLLEIYGMSPDRIIKIPLAMTEGLKEKKTKVAKNRILYANRLAREKRPDVAIRTASILAPTGVQMSMYGSIDHEYANEIGLAKLLEDSSNVEYLGIFDGTKNFDFDSYDICFIPSIYEGIPRIVLDSIKANLYIIGCDVGGMSEVVDSPVTGVLLDSNSSPQDFADAIKKYYSDKSNLDLALRKKMNRGAITEHSKANQESMIVKVYEEIM